MIIKRSRRNGLSSIVLAIAVCIKSFGQAINSPPTAAADSTTTTENVAVTINVVANDTDPDGNLDPASVDLNVQMMGIQKTATNPKGSYSIDDDGLLTFTPADGYSGIANLAYNVRDSLDSVSNNVNIRVTVTAVNSPPVAVPDNAETERNKEVKFDILGNDNDSDGSLDTSKVDLDGAAPGVQKQKNTPQGEWRSDRRDMRFKPANNFTGTATIDYTVADNEGAISNAATVTVTVIAPNEPPVAANDIGATTPDKAVTINVVANDTDSDGTIDPAKVDLSALAGIQNSANTPQGSWTVNAAGVVTYTPVITFRGTATLNYTVRDNDNAPSNSATITVSVAVGNAPPVAANDTGATTLNKPVTVNVVANDTDADGTVNVATVDLNTTTAGIQNTASTNQGTWSVNALGVVTYSPIALFLGSATINYFVSDDDGAVSNSATITITVQAVNIAPVAANDNAITTKNGTVSIRVTDNDTDIDGTINTSTVDLNTTVAGIQKTNETIQGTYSVNNSGMVTYVPTNNFTGIAATTYTVNDNVGATSNTATINITVQNVNSPPVAVDDNGATNQNTAVTVNVVSNDTDSDGVIDAAKVDLNTTTAGVQNTATTPQGSFAVNNIGIVTYTPANNFTGTATLKYTVSDNNGAVSNTAVISIAVQPLNAPVANEDVATTMVNQFVEIDVVDNDRDSDGQIDEATVDLNTATAGIQNTATTPEGNYSVSNVGVVRFTPTKDFIGDATIKYTVKDNKGVLSNMANIIITVEEAPVVPDMAPEIIAFEEDNDTLRYTPGRPIEITSEFVVADVDDDSLASADIGFVTETYATGSDILLFTNTAGIKGTFEPLTGLLRLTGTAPVQDYTAAVRSVQYNFLGKDELHANIKRIYIRLSDGNSFSDFEERVIRVNSSLTDLDIPTAFTPNNDGANDTWKILAPGDISGSDFAAAEVRVYDKRGTVVFGANGLASSWDGTYQGKLLPVDTYYYTIDLKQKQKRYRGVVAILR